MSARLQDAEPLPAAGETEGPAGRPAESESGPEPLQAAAALQALLQARQTTLPRRLGTPGPDAQQLAAIVGAAAHAPDHGRLQPWRFVRVPADARDALAEAFAQALREREPAAEPEALAQAREKAYRSPELLLVVVDAAQADAAVPAPERWVSAGCAVQNLLLMATALGFGSALTSGQSLQSQALRTLFGLRAAEQALCFVSLGTVVAAKAPRARPAVDAYTSTLRPQGAPVPGLHLPPAVAP